MVPVALALARPAALPVAAAVWCVDARSGSGQADGSAAWPFASIQGAVDAAAAGDEVAVAAGHYREAVRVRGKGVRLLGGFAGAASYDGEPGDFSTRSTDPAATWIEGSRAGAVVHLSDAPGSVVDGFRITGGARGVLVDDQAWPPVVENVRLARLLVEGNGIPSEHGGGISALGRRITIARSTVRGNAGANAAGIYLHHCEDVLVEDNLIADNVGHGDHGGGLTLNGSGIVRRNVFRGNRIGESLGYGWGGGVLVVERHAGVVLLQGNIYTGNFAPSGGGAVFVDEGAAATLDHELIAGNRLALMHPDMPTLYFGVGNPAGLDRDEVDALEEEYTNRCFALEGTALFTVTGALRAGAAARFAADSLHDVQPGGDLAAGGVRGFAGGDVVGLGPALEWDGRDAAFAPAAGAWYRAWMRAHRDSLGSDYGFEHYALDLRRYLTVRPGHVLGLQVAADTVRGDVPFYELPSLPLRGLYQGVFVDRTAASFQAEWRFPARGRFAAAVFAGVGGVGDTLADVKPVDLWAAGAGVRYILNRAERITLRLDVGVSPLGVFPYFMVMEAF